jgi:hypothetical protein
MALVDIPHVIHAFHDVEKQQPDGSGEQIVVVLTDLELHVHHPEHDKANVDALMQALSDHVLHKENSTGADQAPTPPHQRLGRAPNPNAHPNRVSLPHDPGSNSITRRATPASDSKLPGRG